MITWFLLFDGSSPDGRGHAEFIGRTENSNKARDHYNQCKRNWHSNGYVQVVTDTRTFHADHLTNWSDL